MCGIFGWQLKKNQKLSAEQRMVVAVLLGKLNEERGTDSFGWYDHDTGEIARGVGRIGPQAMKMARHDSLIGHTRKSTTGAITIENAHPFVYGDIVGAHNGIIHNHDDLNKAREAAGFKKFEVDSQHIFAALDEKWDISNCSGYGSIEWTEKKRPGEIFLCRLSNYADLAIAATAHGTFWSSDDKHLKESLLLAGIKHSFYTVKPEKIIMLQNGDCFQLKEELCLKSYQQSPGVYGSRIIRDARGWMDWREKAAEAGGQRDFFRRLSKKERKRLIKESNEKRRRLQGGSYLDRKLLKYGDVCPCGALVGAGEEHNRWCDLPVNSPTKSDAQVISVCFQCEGVNEHEKWCDKHPDYNKKPTGFTNLIEIKGVKIGEKVVCEGCYEEPDMDGYCQRGHGKVVYVGDAVDTTPNFQS